MDEQKLEQEIFALGSEVFREVQNSKLSIFDPALYTGKLMDWAMQDEDFKISLFRFIDVLPSLSDSASIIRLAQEYFEGAKDRIPGLLKFGFNVDPNSMMAKLAAPIIKQQIRSVAEGFILGETPEAALKSLKQIRKRGLAFTVDLLGEAAVSNAESEVYLQRYMELLDVMARELPRWSESAPLIAGHVGEQTALNISIKLSALYSQAKPVNTEFSTAKFAAQLTRILSRVKELNGYAYIDMEDCGFTEITIEAVKQVLMSEEFRRYDRIGFVIQAYLRRTESDVRELIEWGRKRGTAFGVRLVKGAYWDSETISAKQNSWGIPVWQQKAASDACYERVSRLLLENIDIVTPAFASHNIRSLAHAAKAAELMGIPKTKFELQALYGMAEPIKDAFAKRGYLFREYSPIGELLPGMGYLVRRLLENTSNEGFLRQSFHDNETPEQLLKKPVVTLHDTGEEHINRNQRARFTNEPFIDFTIPAERKRIQTAINVLKQNMTAAPARVQPIVGGRHRDSVESINSISPEKPDFIVAKVELANVALAQEAIESLNNYFPTWRARPVTERAEILFRAADIMRERRADLVATMSLEAGKPWAEADADLAEAIDFCNYYAHEALRIFQRRQMGDLPGEKNFLFYEPRGVAAVIAPWNFPLAIPCGMFTAALVTGNCAILKPAEQTSLIAQKLFEILLEAGLPKEAAAFLPGDGEAIGPTIVSHPLVSTIAFTGSRSVGLSINEHAADTPEKAVHVKRTIIEMGGKNAIIVDDSADLDEAVKGVLHSAFGFAGQKCSACSRVIVLEECYDRFVERLVEGAKSLRVGPATEPSTTVPPVIDEEAYHRICNTIELAKNDCKLLAGGERPDLGSGYFIPPTIFSEIPKGHELLQNEIFGPVLAVVRAKDFDEAIEIALNTEYALTGAIFSRSPKNIDRAIADFRIGNLYINRASTGALVMRQPFGGFKMSGIGSKAGGPDYLLQFTVPRAVSENTMRRGFAPA